MGRKLSWTNTIMYKRHIAECIMKRFDKIKSTEGTEMVQYPQYRNAFDYVDSFFPQAEIKNVIVYFCPKKTLADVGYKNSGGVYCTYSRVIVVANDLIEKCDGIWNSVRARTTPDETLVHELLHYASDSRIKGRKVSSIYEEEFSYGYSIPYFIQKGWTEETIIDNYFLPHLINLLDKNDIKKKVLSDNDHDWIEFLTMSDDEQKKVLKSVEQDLYDETIHRARKEGKKIFVAYKDKRPEKEPIDDDFGFIVL